MQESIEMGKLRHTVMLDATLGTIVAASLLLIGYWLRGRRLVNWTRTPLMFEDEFPDQLLQLQL